MPTGQCLCGSIKFSYTGHPVFTGLCYCNDCRKMPNVQVFQIPKSQFNIVGDQKPSTWTKKSDHGNSITNHFCGTCGTTLWRTGGAAVNTDNIGLRAGVLDDQSLLDTPPAIEVYVEKRPPWISKIESAVQLDGKYQAIEEPTKSGVSS
ncbi:hypothetical protein K431DRAFT_333011 [Polychaeton citri CBS 116435]|uniref:CENP-V/GFA domain-containing protein n=1 Tax=Polychaeton citri CBS 116435 TaxID=1314669 RepID=A0A9P4UMR1_9PEZI|nr:hypothetical protein K431DRAFT_333011 [Polychaeton citri CBS 116435]